MRRPKTLRHIAIYLLSLAALMTLIIMQTPGLTSAAAYNLKYLTGNAAISSKTGSQAAGTSTKEQNSARLNELDLSITSLRAQLQADPDNSSLSTQLNNAINEYNSISASLGGDKALPRGTPASRPAPGAKDNSHHQMRNLETNIESLRHQLLTDPNNQSLKTQLNDAVNQLQSISASMGGDLPTKSANNRAPNSMSVPPGCTASTYTFNNNTPVTIPTGPAVVTSTINVTGAGNYLFDVNVFTMLQHTFAADLDVTIQSPAGTIVTLTTDNGGSNDNVFNGTLWDDDANPAGQVPYTTNDGLVTDHAYVNLVTASPLAPEEALGAFAGENPNGTWTITISDDAAEDGGSLDSWSLDFVTLPSAPFEITTSGSSNTPVTIPTGPAVVTSTIDISSAGEFLSKVTLLTNIQHTFTPDLDITIQSPAGTIVTLTTDNGANNVFNGTLWDDDANPGGQVPYTFNNGLVTDHAYVGLTTASPLVPEEPLAAFRGENPNGTWTITISDDTAGDGGSLDSWSLNVKTASCQGTPCISLPAAQTFSNNTPILIPTGPAVVTSSINVTGASAYLYDINLTTFLTHTFAADLDVTITSPAGTVVTLTTDNGGENDNVFNGTLWDDDANPGGQVPYTSNNGLVTDHVYTNLVTASPLTPEEPLAAFRGENPNGIWKITISDDAPEDGGLLSSWSMAIVSLPTALAQTNTSFTNSTPVTIPTGPAVVTSTINVTGVGRVLTKATVLTNLLHTFAADLDVTIQSPAGTVVTLTTDNGGSNDDVFNGTLWDDNASPIGQVPYTANNRMVTDRTYADLTTATLLTPEEPLGAFVGEDPNGAWTITISDDFAGDGGSLNGWTLNITTTPCDSQDPCIVNCPANVTAVTSICGGSTAVVTYPAPTVSGTCPGVTIACTPPSGSTFPLGVSMVNCTATYAGGSTTTCSFTVTVFNACIQDDNNPGTVLVWNTATGQYRFCCTGTTYTGIGTVTRGKNGMFSLSHTTADRKITATLNCGTSSGQGRLESPVGSVQCLINDTNTGNNSCNCDGGATQ